MTVQQPPAADPAVAPRPPALSPSRAADFRRCPLLYRFRAVDRLPEPPSKAQVRGTLVHAVLERLFALPAPDRTPEAARALLGPAWDELDAAGAAGDLFDGAADPAFATWLDSATALLDTYFALEDPARVPAAAVEERIETVLHGASGPVPLRGILDPLDQGPGGALRVVDYKTGAVPGEGFEGPALFQLKFYALAVLLARGRMPEELRLLYLSGGTALSYRPDTDELYRFARLLDAVWAAIGRAAPDGDFRPNRGPACRSCDHRARCPAWDGTPPPYPGWPGSGGGPLRQA
ncbi:RecB family exonuclease [Pseudonocardia sp. HH130630-07]|uniref:RecB family exonuclease n=1 Tax=Pseudonocardia sp. HH130630-07 TaxID=1690815 RepID=UPI000815366F|nr:PD-(D/E)XK nuclease family protein [Pseudonocardia sp. HH130630-07]ANY09161.1 recombinase RecB [Pseudonocardia sp. HH130630-07]